METTHVRLRVDACCWTKFKEFLSSQQVKIAALCFEQPEHGIKENPHYHAYLLVSRSSLDALKRARSRYFKNDETMKGNGPASLQEMSNPEEYKQYMCKGVKAYKDQYKIYRGRSQYDIEIYDNTIFTKTPTEYQEEFWIRHETDKPKQYKNFTDKLIETWKNFHLDRNEPPSGSSHNNHEIYPVSYYDELERKPLTIQHDIQLQPEIHIVDWLIDYLGIENRPWDKYLIVKYSNLIFWKFKQHFADRTCIDARKRQKQEILQMLNFPTKDI